MFAGLWRPVAACGGLWQPVASDWMPLNNQIGSFEALNKRIGSFEAQKIGGGNLARSTPGGVGGYYQSGRMGGTVRIAVQIAVCRP